MSSLKYVRNKVLYFQNKYETNIMNGHTNKIKCISMPKETYKNKKRGAPGLDIVLIFLLRIKCNFLSILLIYITLKPIIILTIKI